MKRVNPSSYPAILAEVSLLSADQLTLTQIINYKKSDDLLSLLILIEKIELAFYGRTLEEIANSIGGALDTFQDDNNEQIVSNLQTVRLTTIAKKIRDIDIDKSEVGSIVAKGVVETINKAGFLVEDVITTFLDLMKLSENACSDIGRSVLSATRLLQLATPLLTNRNPSVLELYDLIQEFRKGSVVHYDTNDPKYDDYLIAWDKWLSRHPQITKYLDPSFVAIEPGAHALAAVPPIIGSLPNLGGPPIAPLKDFDGAWAGLYQCGTPLMQRPLLLPFELIWQHHLGVLVEELALFIVFVHLQHQLQAISIFIDIFIIGGGVGPIHRICTFTTSAASNIHLY